MIDDTEIRAIRAAADAWSGLVAERVKALTQAHEANQRVKALDSQIALAKAARHELRALLMPANLVAAQADERAAAKALASRTRTLELARMGQDSGLIAEAEAARDSAAVTLREAEAARARAREEIERADALAPASPPASPPSSIKEPKEITP